MKTLIQTMIASLLLAAAPLVATAQDKKGVTAGRNELSGRHLAVGRRADVPEHQPEGAADDAGRVRRRTQDLLRALRRLPRRAAQGRHRQAADTRPDHRQGHRLPEDLHCLRLAGRHAQLADLRRDGREDRRPDGALHPARRPGAAGVRHGADEGDLEGHRPAGPAADEEDEQLQHREHLLDHAARHRRGGADRRRYQEDHQHRQDRLRGAHLAHCRPRGATCS